MALDWCYIYRGSIKVLKEKERERETTLLLPACMSASICICINARKVSDESLITLGCFPLARSLFFAVDAASKKLALLWSGGVWRPSARHALQCKLSLSLCLFPWGLLSTTRLRRHPLLPSCALYLASPAHTHCGMAWAWPHAMPRTLAVHPRSLVSSVCSYSTHTIAGSCMHDDTSIDRLSHN